MKSYASLASPALPRFNLGLPPFVLGRSHLVITEPPIKPAPTPPTIVASSSQFSALLLDNSQSVYCEPVETSLPQSSPLQMQPDESTKEPGSVFSQSSLELGTPSLSSSESFGVAQSTQGSKEHEPFSIVALES